MRSFSIRTFMAATVVSGVGLPVIKNHRHSLFVTAVTLVLWMIGERMLGFQRRRRSSDDLL
jgi:hypothetical protein